MPLFISYIAPGTKIMWFFFLSLTITTFERQFSFCDSSFSSGVWHSGGLYLLVSFEDTLLSSGVLSRFLNRRAQVHPCQPWAGCSPCPLPLQLRELTTRGSIADPSGRDLHTGLTWTFPFTNVQYPQKRALIYPKCRVLSGKGISVDF